MRTEREREKKKEKEKNQHPKITRNDPQMVPGGGGGGGGAERSANERPANEGAPINPSLLLQRHRAEVSGDQWGVGGGRGVGGGGFVNELAAN